MNKHKDADVLVNFASLRSAYESTMETLNYPQVNFGNINQIYHSVGNYTTPILSNRIEFRFEQLQ